MNPTYYKVTITMEPYDTETHETVSYEFPKTLSPYIEAETELDGRVTEVNVTLRPEKVDGILYRITKTKDAV